MNKKIIVGICSIVVLLVIIYMMRRKPKKELMTQKTFTLYYSPMCGHCSAFMGTWEKFKQLASEFGVSTNEINCLEDKNSCANIETIPTLILNNGKDKIKFSELRTIENLINFIKKY